MQARGWGSAALIACGGRVEGAGWDGVLGLLGSPRPLARISLAHARGTTSWLAQETLYSHLLQDVTGGATWRVQSHHVPRTGPFELNDIFAIINAAPAILLLAYGFFTKGFFPGLCFGAVRMPLLACSLPAVWPRGRPVTRGDGGGGAGPGHHSLWHFVHVCSRRPGAPPLSRGASCRRAFFSEGSCSSQASSRREVRGRPLRPLLRAAGMSPGLGASWV